MTKTRKGLFLTLVLSLIVSADACGGGGVNSFTNANAQPSPSGATVRTNVEELGMLVSVPYESEECFWKDDTSHKRIVAVLRFPQAEASRLVADAEKVRPAQDVSVSVESWFPAELIAQSEMSGDDVLSGRSYAANAFYQDPYNEGRIIHISDTDYFILEISAK